MFAPYDGGTDFEGRRVVEKRGFSFPLSVTKAGVEDDVTQDVLELKVFRNKARRRESDVVPEVFDSPGEDVSHVS